MYSHIRIRVFGAKDAVSSGLRSSNDETHNPRTVTGRADRALWLRQIDLCGEGLRSGRIAVVDATSVQPESRKPLVALAAKQDCLPVAIVFDLAEELCVARNRGRANRNLPAGVIRRQRDQMKRSMNGLQGEGFRFVYVLDSVEAVDSVVIERQPLSLNRDLGVIGLESEPVEPAP